MEDQVFFCFFFNEIVVLMSIIIFIDFRQSKFTFVL